MKQDNLLQVYYKQKLVGTLAMTGNRKTAFQYSEEWIENGFPISPFSLPLKDQVFVPTKDLTYSNTYYGEHTTSVDGNGKNPGEKEILAVGTKAGMEKDACIEIMRMIQTNVKEMLGEYIGM